MLYHVRPLEYAQPQVVTQVPEDDPYFRVAYGWLEQQLGFHGVFLAAGDEKSIDMTGYWQQFERRHPQDVEQYRNQVLFGFRDVPGVRFSDYEQWHRILNSAEPLDGPVEAFRLREVSGYVGRLVLKPSWQQSDWLRAARGHAYVQAHAPKLDLTAADEVWCRNERTRRALGRKGFDVTKVVVRRPHSH